ncbi:histidine phosphatase superfamily [Lipomyces arxii]|uniref:histidine phosphatase superfamily n=1 Tax=Lipomyces arxii TaxID=56418 RepID=UPI0034CD68F0
MAVVRLLLCLTLLKVVAAASSSQDPRFLAPDQDIVFWKGAHSKNALQSLGANGPWFQGPNVFDISNDVPENCYVEQAAYMSRHGSRYPDQGAYNGWKEMESRFSFYEYTAHGPLAFLPEWRTVLTHPEIQIAMESPTGYKEAMDMAYQLRTRYPDLYQEGNEFYVWANNYTRVLQTAQNFARGFIGTNATSIGHVVSVTSRDFVSAIGNSLAPSDQCPNFVDASGGAAQPVWDAIWQPKVQKRLQKYIRGNLTLTLSDINQIPYLCGFESQITGRVSRFCDIFKDLENEWYEYSNDLRYYYGVGPGTDLPHKMMTPFLKAVLSIFQQGPNIIGTSVNADSPFKVPNLLVSFLNDGQLTELVTSSGVFDAQKLMDPKKMDPKRIWNGSRYVTMRGTIAFEKLNCLASAYPSIRHGSSKPQNSTFIRIMLNDQVYPLPSCNNGPGKSCPLNFYVNYVEKKLKQEGSWIKNCNVTVPGAPTKVAGASFFTDLAQPHLSIISP